MKRRILTIVVLLAVAWSTFADGQVRVTGNLALDFVERPSVQQVLDSFKNKDQPFFWGFGWEVVFSKVGLGGLYDTNFYEDYETMYFNHKPWDDEVEHFYETLRRLDTSIARGKPRKVTEEQLLQGPLSDAMTHVGQLSMLRRLTGSPIPSENFIFANIRVGGVGPDQPDPVAPDE